MKMKLLLAVLFLSASFSLYASLRTDTPEATIAGFSGWYHGDCFSDGKRLLCGNGYSGTATYSNKLFIFNNIPSSSNDLINANIKITNFNTTYQYQMPSPCIVGNKLLATDTDMTMGGSGYHIKIWNTLPETGTTASTYNNRILGYASGTTFNNLNTDGISKFCANYLAHELWLWNSVPENNTDTSSVSAVVGAYAVGGAWYGASGRFYACYNGGAQPPNYVMIFDSTPSSGNYGPANAKATITCTTQWGPSVQAVEMRNILYVFALYSGKIQVYVWRNIPSANTDTTTADDRFFISQNPTYGNIKTADLHNFYYWDGVQGNNLVIYKNDYDTFTVTGANLAPSTIDQRHKNQPFERVRIYSYPGKAMLNTVKLNLTGNCSDGDIDAVKIYSDVNNDSDYTQGTDVLMASGTFSNKTVTFSNLDFYVDAGEKNILVTFDISENSTLNNTVGVNVEYMVFEKRFYEYPSGMSSNQSTVVSSIIPNWNNELRVNNTQNQSGADTLFLISLDWDDASGGALPLTYKIYHYTDNVLFQEFAESVSQKVVTNLDISKKHKFMVRVYDSFGNYTQDSNYAYDDVSPEWTGNFRIQDSSKLVSQNKWDYKIQISWSPATDNTSKSILYELWMKEEGKDWELKKATWENSIEVANLSGTVYVKMRARDPAGNYGEFGSEKKIRVNPFLMLAEDKSVDSSGGSLVLDEPEGEKVQLEIPEGALAGNYRIIIEKSMESEYTYKFSVYDSSNREKTVLFNKPVTIKFFYNEEKLARLGQSEDDLHVMYYDGLKWSNIGGEVNKSDNTVKAVTHRFSKYKLSGEKYGGEKRVLLSSEVLTPNDDGINDALIFTPDWNFSGQMTINIFDVTGRIVWQYAGTDKSVVWRCRTENQNPVESGVYLYSIRVDDIRYNGTVTVSR